MAPAPEKPKQKSKPKPSAAKTGYLVAYNFVSAVLWATVLGRTAAVAYLRGPALVPVAVSEFARWTQTLAGLEVVHSALGVVRAPLFTTLMQVSSRFLLLWGVVYPFPHLASSPFYTSMLLAWSLTEVIRYGYFALSLCGVQPAPFTWLRYSTFTVLYPVGISSECALLLKAATDPSAAAAVHPLAPYVLYAILASYVPGSYVLYTYMLKQRRKVLGRLGEGKEGKAE